MQESVVTEVSTFVIITQVSSGFNRKSYILIFSKSKFSDPEVISKFCGVAMSRSGL